MTGRWPRRRQCGQAAEVRDERAGAAARVEDLRRGAAEVHALRGVNLSVDAGELVAVMGPSGSGKSTLLTIAGSLEEPTSGEVLVGGAALSGMSRNDRARLRRRSIGYVFQDFNLLAGLTAAENVSLPLELDGMPRQDGPRGRPAGAGGARPGRAGRRGSPTSCPAGSASGWRSPARWSATAACCWPTSRRARWTRSTAEAVMRLHPRRLPAGRGRGGGDPRRAAGLVGRPGGVPAGRAGRRPDRAAARPRVAARAGPQPVSTAAARNARPRRRRRQRRRSGPAGRDPLGVAAVPPGVAPAAAGPGADHRRRGRHHRRGGGGHQHAAAGRRRVRHRAGPRHVPGAGPAPGRPDRRAAAPLRPRRRHREPDARHPGSIDTYDLRAQNPHGPFGQPMLSLVSGHYPSRPGPGGGDQRGGLRLRPARSGTSGTQGGAARRVVGIVREPAEPAGRVRPGGARPGHARRPR